MDMDIDIKMLVQHPSSSNPILTTVYAIHDFQAENPDELSFTIGELITVTEKDDQYGDGWWQGRNSKGAFGLFPKDYTSVDPPSNSKPTMNDTLYQVQNAIDQLHNPSTSSTLSLPAVLSSASQNSIHPTDHSEDDHDPSRTDHTTWNNNATAAQARALLAEKAKANALAHQLVMDRLKSASQQLYPVPHSPSSSHVSIPELDEIDFSEESGDDLHQQVQRAHSRDARQHSKAPTQPPSHKVIGAADTPPLPSSIPPTPNQRINQAGPRSLHNLNSEDDHEPSSSLASGPFSAAALALGLTHTPASPVKLNPSPTCIPTQPSSRVQSIPLHPSHKPKQLSSSSILSDMSSFVNRDPRAASPPIASTLRMSRESSQLTHPHQLDHIRDQSHPKPTSLHAPSPIENPLSIRAPSSQQDNTSLTSPLNPILSALRTSEVQYPSKSFITPDFTKEHLASLTNLRPNSLEAIGSFHQRQRSASSAESGVFVRQQNTSPFHPHSPPTAILSTTTATINNVHNTSNSTGDSSSARGSRSRSSSRLAAVGEDQLTSPATSTFPSVSGKHQGPASLSSLGGPPNGFGMKSGFSGDPSQWTVAEVVEWGKIKNLDEFTISKFIEHEITGDVLLEFDIHTLKEIDLIAFGRRVKLIKAIDEIRKIDSKALPPIAGSTSHHQDLSQLSMQSPTEGRQSALSSEHKRSESANHSIRGAAGPPPTRPVVTPDQAVAPSHGSMGSIDLQHDFSDQEAGGDSGKFVGGGGKVGTARRKSSLTGLVHEVKKHTGGLSFTGLGRKSEADSDSVHNFEAPSSASWQQHPKREIAIPEIAEKDDELYDKFGTALSSTHEPAEATNSNKKIGKRQQASSKRPGTANSILSRNPFSSSGTAITADSGEQAHVDPPSSPEITTGARQNDMASSSVKSRTSFLGKVRGGRKPPPQLFATVSAGESSLGSPAALSAGAAADQTGSQGKKGRFNFGHQAQVQHQIQAVDPNTVSSPSLMEKEGTPLGPGQDNGAVSLTVPKGSSNDGQKTRSALERIGTPDHVGWMKKKGEKYPTWKMRYFILKNANLYYLKSENEARIKGLIKLAGYKVVMDDDVNPGRYGFKIIHDNGSTHAFSADDSKLLRDWMKAMMKATIDRDWLAPVISSCNIPTMPIGEAQKMFPPPRPPSPASRTRAQKARLASNQELLMHKDPSVLMDMQRIAAAQQQQRFSIMIDNNTPPASPPQSLLRPTRSVHRKKPNPMIYSPPDSAGFKPNQQEDLLLNWINSNLPKECPEKAQDFSNSIRSGLVIVRLIENLTKTESGLSDDAFEIHKVVGGDGDMFNEVDIYFNVFDYLQKQRIPLEGYALNDMISGDPFKNKEFLLRVYNHFNRIKNFVVAHI